MKHTPAALFLSWVNDFVSVDAFAAHYKLTRAQALRTIATGREAHERNAKPRALLDKTDPRYLRRLVRECNALPDGFYSGPRRYTRARLCGGLLEGGTLASYLDPQDPRNGRRIWIAIDADHLSDAYGRTVCASRVLVRKDAPRP